jgi:hypothetical protein
MRRPLRVLITSHALAGRTGTEMYVRDVAKGLLLRGHTPIVYSPRLGPLARELSLDTVAVVDDLNQLAEPPDVIHGQHTLESAIALLHFPQTPAMTFRRTSSVSGNSSQWITPSATGSSCVKASRKPA